MKDPAYTIKTGIVMALLAIESYALTTVLLAYVRTEDYFTPSFATLGIIAGLLLLIAFTYALTIGAWRKWEQYVIVPLPVALGILVGLFLVNPTYATVSAAVAYALISYDVFLATHLKSLLIKFDARTILRTSTRGFLFVFALLGGILVLVHSTEKNNTFDISGVVADMAQKQIDLMMPSVTDAAMGELGEEFPIPPEQFGFLSGMQGGTNSLISGLPTINLDLRETVKTEVDSIIEPYRQFIPPLIALVVFALIRFLGGLVHIVFNITVPIVFSIARSAGWFHVSYVNVQQEQLSFSAPQQAKTAETIAKELPDMAPQN